MLELTKIESLKNSLFSNYDSLTKHEIRESIVELENQISTANIEGRVVFHGDSNFCPLEHDFSEGVYLRKLSIPKGTLVVGKIHKHQHHNIITKGKAIVISEDKRKEIVTAPCTIVSEAGVKKIVYALEDTEWINVHNNPTNSRDISFLEEQIISNSYEEYNKFLKDKNSAFSKLKKVLIKNLSI